MKAIYAPWRMTYLKANKPNGCVFCKDSIRSDDLILLEAKTAYVMLNMYPYINGHLMVIPYRHVCKLDDLSAEEKLELFELTSISVNVLKETLNPEGFNIGINMGKPAGAGVDDHVHIHIVPRWVGDTNFMTIIGEVRVIPDDLKKTWENLVPHFKNAYKIERKRPSMKVIYTVLAMLLILFIITFSLANTVPVRVEYHGLFSVEWPIYMLLFVSCMFGIIFTGCLGLVERFRLSKTIARLNKTIRDLRRDIRLYEEVKTSATTETEGEKEEKPL